MFNRIRESIAFYFNFIWNHEADDADMTEMRCSDCSCGTKLQYRNGFLFANARIDGVSSDESNYRLFSDGTPLNEYLYGFFICESLTPEGARAMARGLGLEIVNRDGEVL